MHPRSFYVFPDVYTTCSVISRKKAGFIGERQVCLQNSEIFEAVYQIGINYKGQRWELKGCNNDIGNIFQPLVNQWGYHPRDITLLTDEGNNPLPTRSNILYEMHRLVSHARAGDSMFVHFSGHGSQVRDADGDEVDGYDEVIFPVDYQESGVIVDDEIHDILVKPLPAGCRLTALFDSCHSGTVLDLPYIYQANGRLRSHTMNSQALAKYPKAHVVLFAGCSDLQGSGGIIRGGEFLGAMSAFYYLLILAENSTQTYLQVLASVKDILRRTQKQTPQLSSSYPIVRQLHAA
ncbi:hypothetical protein K503DRAFT_695443 [Rhizopogon vinicolor AM-OR11-026]|uniref:Peptidase C14 caspase domain-containing protein n=1 Tax=Rhizopogon vinicolor AM-OR11-026 TaxID=1314800 RepID=A0A1B7MUI0_9AGAM|nr:hypothetical protein K503DRAFT_695443 [Rhizopogon vinicolor AM-OR11-026]